MSDEWPERKRQIEELIGWRRAGPLILSGDWIDGAGRVRMRAEVDDLAAWLDERVGPRNWAWQRPTESSRWLVVWRPSRDVYWDHVSRATDGPRDALIAAVRKVAAEVTA